ncbi:GNAT family N-acetyltransferase [uncultured Abyssibacter sp.]|uniref:GNAT family N-acetyltransferase n=1 Tax=uncultured Abyssibacter sp. TaxID=2320202 RepID=UPI0032B1EC95
MTEIAVRPARADDLQSVCDLADQINAQHHDALPETFAAPDSHGRDREFWLRQITRSEVLFLVAHQQNAVRGFITATIQDGSEIPFLQSSRICRIGTIVVDARFRGGRIGTVLMEHAERWALTRGASEIRLEVMAFNTEAKAFYERLQYGFHSHILRKPIEPQ